MSLLSSLRPIDAAKFKEISENEGLSPRLVERRAAGLRTEIAEQLKDSSHLPLHERVAVVNTQIQAFVAEIGEMDGQFKAQATDLGRDLATYVQSRTKESFQRETAAEARKADQAFSQFQAQVKERARQVKNDYEQALADPQADVLAVVAQASGSIGGILAMDLPNTSIEVADLPPRMVQELQEDLANRALKAQMKKAKRAFGSFLENKKRIDKATKFLTDTKDTWIQKAGQLGRGLAVVGTLANEDFSIPQIQAEKNALRTLMDQGKRSVDAEMQTLHALMKLPRFEGDFASSSALQNSKGLKKQAERADALLRQAAEVQNLAKVLTKAKSSVDGYGNARAETDRELDEAQAMISELTHLIREYETDKIGEIEGLFDAVKETHGRINETLSTMSLMQRSLKEAIPNIDDDFEPLTRGVSVDLGRQEVSLQHWEIRFAQFRDLEERFNGGAFEGLTEENFISVPDTLYKKLRETVAEKLKPLSEGKDPAAFESARKYKDGLKNFLIRIGGNLDRNFKLPQLKRTWSETFRAFIFWLRSLFSCKSESAFVDLPSPKSVTAPPEPSESEEEIRREASMIAESEGPASPSAALSADQALAYA